MNDDSIPDPKCLACERPIPSDVDVCPHGGRPVCDVPPVVMPPAHLTRRPRRLGRYTIILLSVAAALSFTAAFPPWLKVRWEMRMLYLGLTEKKAELAVDFAGFDFIFAPRRWKTEILSDYTPAMGDRYEANKYHIHWKLLLVEWLVIFATGLLATLFTRLSGWRKKRTAA